MKQLHRKQAARAGTSRHIARLSGFTVINGSPPGPSDPGLAEIEALPGVDCASGRRAVSRSCFLTTSPQAPHCRADSRQR